MIDIDKLRNDLENIYGYEKIIFYAKDKPYRENEIYIDGKTTIKYVIRKKDKDVTKLDFVILVNSNIDYEIAIIWDNTERKKNNDFIQSFSTNKFIWDNMLPEGKSCSQDYIRGKNGNYKVVFMKLDMLEYYKYDLYDIITPSSDDSFLPRKYLNDENYSKERRRTTCSRAERYYKFRNMVLEHYNYKCALCGCDIKEVLEAAHIIAVKDGGKEVLENGICLCANHHRILDHDLIRIDTKTKRLKYISSVVSNSVYGRCLLEMKE